MEAGAAVWVRDKQEAWVAGKVVERSAAGKPCTVKIEVDEDVSEEPLTFTISEDDGERCMYVASTRALQDRQHSNSNDTDVVCCSRNPRAVMMVC